jgi:uncharacterized RDD family membrane protein YckC
VGGGDSLRAGEPMAEPPQDASVPSSDRAGIVSRFCAFAIDVVILSACVGGLAWLLDVTARGLRRFAPPLDLGALLVAVVPLFVALYHIVLWTAFGQTPGKWVMGLRVVRCDGGPLSVGRALVRWFGYLLSALPFYLGFLWILGPSRRAWHDRLAKTEVVHVREAGTEESLGAGGLRRRWSQRRPRPAT